jgi:hypothetical protein
MNKVLVGLLVVLPGVALAQMPPPPPPGGDGVPVCVRIDESRDTLSPEDRRGAVITLGHVVARYGETVVEAGCAASYTLYHVKLGNTVTVYLYGPQGFREAKAGKLDDLPFLYEQMVASLRTGQQMATGNDTVDRTNATTEQMVPRRIAADNVKYVRLGYGGTFGGNLSGGPSFGIGWRHELDTIAIDISALNLIVATDSFDDDKGVSGSWLQLCVLYFARPIANSSPYFGGGVSWGVGASSNDDGNYGGTGLQGQIVGGFEILRASTIRLFVQADVGLPFYRQSSGDDKRWVPNMSISMGVGWGKSNTIGVVAR